MNRSTTRNRLLAMASAASLLLACSLGGLTAAGSGVRGSGHVVEESRAVSGISAVNLDTMGDLTIELGDTEALRIEAEDNLVPFLETEVHNGELRIATRPGVELNPTQPVRYFLTAKQISGIGLSSSGDVQGPDLSADHLDIELSSSGDLQLGNLDVQSLSVKLSSSGRAVMGQIQADTLDAELSSSGGLTIAGGRVERQKITLSSSGDYKAENLESGQTSARLTSSGSATIWVRDSLDASLTSGGNLRYRGSPKVDASATSSGAVIQIGG